MFQAGAVGKKVICGIRTTLQTEAGGHFQELDMNLKLQRHFFKAAQIVRLEDVLAGF